MRRSTLFVVALALSLGIGNATAQRATELPDVQVREAIIKESIAAYKATGHPCACLYSLTRKGSPRGRAQRVHRTTRAKPICYPPDVTDHMISDWKHQHATEGPAEPR